MGAGKEVGSRGSREMGAAQPSLACPVLALLTNAAGSLFAGPEVSPMRLSSTLKCPTCVVINPLPAPEWGVGWLVQDPQASASWSQQRVLGKERISLPATPHFPTTLTASR